MQRIVKGLIALTIIFSLCACSYHNDFDPDNPNHQNINQSLDGDWSSEMEDLRIHGTEIEFIGYYNHDDQTLAGVNTLGQIIYHSDDKIEVIIDDMKLEAKLIDENTLVIGEVEYKR